MLTADQLARLSEHRDRWVAARLGNPAGDRAAAELGVELAYQSAGLAPPDHIAWCAGPLELVRSWEDGRCDGRIGANVRGAVLGHVRDRAEASARLQLGNESWTRVLIGSRSTLVETVGAAVDRAILQVARSARPPLAQRLAQLFRAVVNLRWPMRGGLSFERAGFGMAALQWVGAMDFLHEAKLDLNGSRDPTTGGSSAIAHGLSLLATNVSWVIPHERVCWLAERPRLLAYDPSGRLHCATGPALVFGDGFKTHAWKGIDVPARLIEDPGAITISSIDDEPDIFVRRCMIEIMEPARFLALGGASRIAQDETGVLWRKTWFTGDAWAAVEVVNGTPEPDGSYRRYVLQVPPELGSARAAVAWTYGLSEHQYARLSIRT